MLKERDDEEEIENFLSKIGRWSKIDDKTKQKAITLYQDGLPFAQIVDICSISSWSLAKLVKEAGINRNNTNSGFYTRSSRGSHKSL